MSLSEAKTQILRTRAYISYHVGFINNFRECLRARVESAEHEVVGIS